MNAGRYHGAVNRRRAPYAALLQLAFVATLLMVLAPLVSRWQQAQGPQVMLMPGGMAHVMAAAIVADEPAEALAPAMDHHGMGHHDMAMHDTSMQAMATHGPATSPTGSTEPAPKPSIDPHAGHGEACEYCMMASRLMPWLAVLFVLLHALQLSAPPVPRTVATRSLRWPAHAARGPPLYA